MEPTVEDRAEQPYVAIPVTAPLHEWGRVNALVPEVFGWLAERGIAPAGALFYRYYEITDDGLRVEVGVPVGEPVDGDKRVLSGVKPAGRYAVLTHRGHPDRIRESFAVLDDWAPDAGVEWDVADGVWAGRFESYLTNPADEPDPAKWETEIAYRLR